MGAELVLTDPKLSIAGSVDKALEIAATSPDYFVPQQFQNPANPKTHYETTAPELVSQLGRKIDIYVSGIGDGFIPDILDTSIITDIVEVSDEDAINTARELARVQGLLVGTSSGANVWAAKKMAEKYGRDKIITTILADRAERYFSTALI